MSNGGPSLEELWQRVTSSVGGMFRFGKGIVGKSAIVVGVLLLSVLVGVSRVSGNLAIISVLGIGVLILMIWLFPILHYARKHPQAVLLEGAEWKNWSDQQVSIALKGVPNPPQTPVIADPQGVPMLPGEVARGQDE